MSISRLKCVKYNGNLCMINIFMSCLAVRNFKDSWFLSAETLGPGGNAWSPSSPSLAPLLLIRMVKEWSTLFTLRARYQNEFM